MLRQLSARENVVKYFVQFLLPSLYIYFAKKKKALISEETLSYIAVDSTHKENITFTK
jgi:hypothetical protein